jgi:hypothetical protein
MHNSGSALEVHKSEARTNGQRERDRERQRQRERETLPQNKTKLKTQQPANPPNQKAQKG